MSTPTTLPEMRAGDILRFAPQSPGFAAPVGALARVVRYPSRSLGRLVDVEWLDRSHLQLDGAYSVDDFAPAEAMGATS